MYSTTCCLYLSILAIGFASYLPETKSKNVSPGNIPDAFNFEVFLKKYGKLYGPVEETFRAKLFFTRTLDIYKANVLYASNKSNHYLSQNAFIDLSPEEVKGLFLDSKNALPTVNEAAISPDTPADYFVSREYEELELSGINDGMTRSTLSDLSSAPGVDELKFRPNFFKASKDFDTSELFKELSRDPPFVEELSRVINVKERTAARNSHSASNQRIPNIAFKPVVNPTNPDYDPSILETRGFSDRKPSYNRFDSNHMMNDFLGFLEPYPTPFEEQDEIYESDRGILTNFVGSLKTFRDNFMKSIDEDLGVDNRRGAKPDEKSPEVLNEPDRKSTESGLVYDIDWRQNGCISHIKNQGKCNSCYAFAVLDLFEYAYCRQMNEATEFSVQHVIDCGTSSGLRGCQGGRLSSVKHFINTYGLQVSSLYPYVALDQTCLYDRSELVKASLLKPNIARWNMYSGIKAWYKWISATPIIVGINMPNDFLAYGGGIHDGLDCTAGMGHALLLVGAGKEDGKPFWLLKNSFSKDWGEDGYFRLSRKAPIKCFESAVVVRVSFKGSP